jgi:hypothetical protein
MAEETRKLPFDLQSDEQLLQFTRRHWAFLAWALTKMVLALIVPIVALIVIANLTFGLDGRGGQVVALICAVWALTWLVKIYFAWYRYNHDVWVVTNQRIVDSIKNHWFHHKMASADLDDVADISVKKHGLFPTMFNYGDLLLQTAGEKPNFVLSGIPAPSAVLALVDAQRDVAKRRLRGV